MNTFIVTLFAQGSNGGATTSLWAFSDRKKAQAFIDSGEYDSQAYNAIESAEDRENEYDIVELIVDQEVK